MNVARRFLLPRSLLVAQVTLVMICTAYWNVMERYLPRSVERPMEVLTYATVIGLPLLGFAAGRSARLFGWKRAAFLMVQTALYLTFLATLLPTVQ